MVQTEKTTRFPKRFLWGASTAAHQVEGGTYNQWSVWELEQAKSLAAQAEYQYGDLPNWAVIKSQATNPENYVSGDAVNHYELYEKDFDVAQKMNLNAFRFSIEWSRIEPQEGIWDAEAIDHYIHYVEALQKRGIEPIVTLFHFTLPLWFVEKGGFEKKSNVSYFVRFAEKILQDLGSSIKFVITINEPEVYAFESYYVGNWPPNKRSKRQSLKVLNTLIYAHKKTAALIHSMNRRYKVSIAKNSSYYYSGDDATLSRWSAHISQYAQDDYVLKRVYKHCDFLGVNYYFANRIYGYRVHNPEDRISDLGWDLNPDVLEQALERLHDKYNLPIIITENGLADANDEDRIWFLSHTINAMQKAISYGVDLQGYLHWSLLDNFEWDKGKWPRFGLLEVDYKTLKRKPRPSAIWMAKVVKKLRSDT